MDRAFLNQMISMRTRAQAFVLLTSRDDLDVQEHPGVDGIDLIVSILKDKRPTGRQFGVILHGHVRAYTSLKQAASVLNSAIARREDFDPGPWPICIFSFVMTGREGVYAWLVEPSIGESGPRVRWRDRLECRDLEKASLGEIVRQVDEFYDALIEMPGKA
jgi:hypothetical protein